MSKSNNSACEEILWNRIPLKLSQLQLEKCQDLEIVILGGANNHVPAFSQKQYNVLGNVEEILLNWISNKMSQLQQREKCQDIGNCDIMYQEERNTRNMKIDRVVITGTGLKLKWHLICSLLIWIITPADSCQIIKWQNHCKPQNWYITEKVM